jgi:hypothetical protein
MKIIEIWRKGKYMLIIGAFAGVVFYVVHLLILTPAADSTTPPASIRNVLSGMSNFYESHKKDGWTNYGDDIRGPYGQVAINVTNGIGTNLNSTHQR